VICQGCAPAYGMGAAAVRVVAHATRQAAPEPVAPSLFMPLPFRALWVCWLMLGTECVAVVLAVPRMRMPGPGKS
jgi:hypothetical protein